MDLIHSVLPKTEIQINQVISRENLKQIRFSSTGDQPIYIDDTIETCLIKFNHYIYSNYKTGIDCLYVWYEIDDTLVPFSFEYKESINYKHPLLDSPDPMFVDSNGTSKFQALQWNDQLLLETCLHKHKVTKIPQLYVLHIRDWIQSIGIPNKKATGTGSIDSWFHGWVHKYWPKLPLDSVLKQTFPKMNRQTLNCTLGQTELLQDFFPEYKHKLSCEQVDIRFLKVDTPPVDPKPINLVKLFSQFQLTEQVPFSKLVVDGYMDSYYKLFKPSVSKGIIEQELVEHWIHDFKRDNQFGYNQYVHYDRILVFKVYVKSNYASLLLHPNGMVTFIFDRTRLKRSKDESYFETNEAPTKSTLETMVKTCNELLTQLQPWIGLDTPVLIDPLCFQSNQSVSKVDTLKCDLRFPRFPWSDTKLRNFFENLIPFSRTIDEKYTYRLAQEDSIYLRYKRVNNYKSEDSIQSMLSVLSHPRLNLSKDRIIDKLQVTFTIPLEIATQTYEDWWAKAQEKMTNNQKYYAVTSSSESGAEVNIIQKIGSTQTLVELSDVRSFDEFQRILVFLETAFSIYTKYHRIKLDWKSHGLFKKQTKLKRLCSSLPESEPENVVDLLDETPEEIYANPVLVEEPVDEEPVEASEEEDYVDPFEMGGDMEGGAVDITRYTMRRLTDSQRDPNLFRFKALQKGPSGAPLTYSRICGAAPRRQPIVVSNEELAEIDAHDELVGSKSYAKPQGKQSLKFGSTEQKRNEFNYICPRYWDIENNRSLAPDKKYDPDSMSDEQLYQTVTTNDQIDINDKQPFIDDYLTNRSFQNKSKLIELLWNHIPETYWDARQIIPGKVTKGKTEQTIYDRKNSSYWRNAGKKLKDEVTQLQKALDKAKVKLKQDPTNVKLQDLVFKKEKQVDKARQDRVSKEYKEYVVRSLGPGYRDDTIDMPCCFTNTSVNKQESVIKGSVQTYQIPSTENSVSELNAQFYKLIKQDTTLYGKHKEIDDTLRQISDLLSKKPKGYLSKIKLSIDSQYYQKIDTIDSEGVGLRDIYPFGFFKLGVGKDNRESLLRCLAKTVNLSLQEFKDKIIQDYTLVMFQNSNLPLYFRVPFQLSLLQDFSTSQSLLKQIDVNLDPLFLELPRIKQESEYRDFIQSTPMGKTYDSLFHLFCSYRNFQNYVQSNEYKSDIYFQNVYESLYETNVILLEDIYSDIKLKTPLSNYRPYGKFILLLQKTIYYEPIVYQIEQTAKSKVSFSNLDPEYRDILQTYSETKLDLIYTYTKTPYPKETERSYKYRLGLFECDPNGLLCLETKLPVKGLDTIIDRFESKGVLIDAYYLDGFNRVSHVLTQDNYWIPIQPQLPQKLNQTIVYDLSQMQTYRSLDEYLVFFKQHKSLMTSWKPEGLSVISSNTIVNLFINGGFVPVKPEQNKTKLPILSTFDVRQIDKDIQIGQIYEDEFTRFQSHYLYEQTLTTVFNEHMIQYILSNPSITLDLSHKLPKESIPTLNTLTTWKQQGSLYELTTELQGVDWMGVLIDSQPGKVKVKCQPLQYLKTIQRDTVRIKEDKRILLYVLIYVLSKQITHIGPVDIHKPMDSLSCFDSDTCDYPCTETDELCRLLMKDTSYSGVNLRKKLCWKFVDMILTHHVDSDTKLQELLDSKFEPYLLEKTAKTQEYFFTYRDYKEKNRVAYLYSITSEFLNQEYVYF